MVAQVALVLWIVISIGLFAVMRPVRAFLLVYVIGYLFLPVEIGDGVTFTGSIYITQSLRIEKLTACNIGAILGTLLFATHMIRRFRFHWVDLVYGCLLAGAICTSLVNSLGAKDGISHAVEDARKYLPLMILARIYLSGPAELLEAMRAILGGAFVYSFLCVAEWRLSPQTHRLVYGYFQHSFDQFIRYSHYRPVGFLHHAIEASFFLGTSAALASWLWLKGMLHRPLWGWVPGWAVVLALFVGTLSTMTYSGIAACLSCCGVLALVGLTRSRWLLAILPAAAIIWMAGRYTGAIDASLLMRAANSMDPARSESLAYRFESERLNLDSLSHDLLLGKGAAQGIVRSEDGAIIKAVDAWWLLTLVFYGVVGLVGWYLFWGAGLIETITHWSRLSSDLRILAAAAGVLVGAQFVDFLFNSFPSPFLLMLAMGTVGAIQLAREGSRRERLRAMWDAQLIEPQFAEGAALP